MEDTTVGFDDCLYLQQRVNNNFDEVASVMLNSLQPIFRYASIEEVATDLGLANVGKGLGNLALIGSTDLILEREDPRILHCSSSSDVKLCDHLGLVPSADGLSIGISKAGQETDKSQRIVGTHERYRFMVA